MTDCKHLQLKLCKVENTTFYQCVNVDCLQNFSVKPLKITVSYGRPSEQEKKS